MKKLIALLIICSMLFTVGCGGKEPVKKGVSPFVGGKVALEGEFMEGAPPNEIYDQGSSSFAIGLKLKNVGEHLIEAGDGYVEVLGINARDFDKTSQADLKKDLPGIRGARKSTDGTTLEGDAAFVDFANLKYLPDLQGSEPFKFRANLCYNYKTKTSTKICINKNLVGTVGESICEVTDEKETRNSGAPIHISNFKQTPLGANKIQLTFDVEHVGDNDDMFYKIDTACDDARNNNERYMVLVKVTSDVDGILPSCNGLREGSASEGYVSLFSKQKASVVCSLDLTNVDSVFEDIFEVELNYRYHQYFEKEIDIRDVG